MKKKILLTGSSGFIGKNIMESFLKNKYDITAPSSKELNLLDTNLCDNFFKDKYYDAIWHCACKPGHRNAKDRNNLLYSNLRMFLNLERNQKNFNKLINFGSGAIYDNSFDIFSERESCIFDRMGMDEHSFCKYIQGKISISSKKFITLNIFGIFGKYEDWEIRFISNAICKTLYDLPITIKQNRKFSYLYINDLMPILDYFTCNEAKQNFYNIVPDEKIELKEIAEYIKSISNKNPEIKISETELGLEYTGDNTLLREEIPKVKFTDIKSAIRQLYEYYENNINKISKNILIKNK